MKRNYFFILVLIALACLIFIFFSIGKEIATPVTKEPQIPSPLPSFKSYISGVGIIEPSSENINIGTHLNRIVDKIFFSVGDKVKKGDILFSLENRDLQANLMAQEAAYKSALAKVQRLEAFPRQEDLAAAAANLKSAKADLDSAKMQYQMVLDLPDPRSISLQERNRRVSNYQQAESKWEQAQAEFEKIRAGTWKPDLEIARLEAQEAEANVNRFKAEIERTLVRSPIDGTILQIKIHEGEFDTLKSPGMIIGNTDVLNLRVSINQLDVPYFNPKAPAEAFLQGDARIEFPLEFIRVEPFLINKQNLTNDVAEKVDTQVLHIIYRIKRKIGSYFLVSKWTRL